MNTQFFVIADTFYGCQLIDAPEAQSEFLAADDFISSLPRLSEGDTMWTILTREQADHVHAEYGITDYKPLEEDSDDE